MTRKKHPPPPPPDPEAVRRNLERAVLEAARGWYDAKTAYGCKATAVAEDALLLALAGLGMAPPSRKRRD
jgi:MYXO-CTERM domain-containing protein